MASSVAGAVFAGDLPGPLSANGLALLVRVDAKNEVTLNGVPSAMADYEQRMKQLMDVRVEDLEVIVLTADDAANFGVVVQVVDKSRAAGGKTAATATSSPDEPAKP